MPERHDHDMTTAVKCRDQGATIIFSADRFLMHEKKKLGHVLVFWKEIQYMRTERKKFVDRGRHR